MSRMTDIENQANMYCGFYPSTNGDRKYGSSDFGKFLNGLICDGVFLTVHDQFKVSPASTDGSSRAVKISTGKAWFNNTWLELIDEYSIECAEAYDDGDRYDAIVIAINTTNSPVTYDEQTLPRMDTTIISIRGTKATAGTPAVPITAGKQEVIEGVYLYPIANIYRGRSTAAITASDIYYTVGTEVCPYVEALVTPSNDATEFTEMWNAQLDNYIAGLEAKWQSEVVAVHDQEWNEYFDAKTVDTDAWIAAEKGKFDDWFEYVNSLVDTEGTLADLVNQIVGLEWDNYLACGFPYCTTTVSEDGKTITSVSTDRNQGTNGWKLVKEFNDDFSFCTIGLYDTSNNHIKSRFVSISEDGNVIRTDTVRPSPII